MDPALLNSRSSEIFNAVEELHKLGAEEISSLFKGGARSLKVRLTSSDGSVFRVDLEYVAQGLAQHIIALLLCVEKDRTFDKAMKYLLRAVRFLYTLSEVAFRNAILGQILHEDTDVREQVLELINFMLICLASYDKETEMVDPKMNCSGVLTHAALSACTMHLLTVYIGQEWSEIGPVVLLHPQASYFVDAAFDTVTKDMWLFGNKLFALSSKLMAKNATIVAAERYAYSIGQHCEAALQALQSLCECQDFKQCVLSHEELCRKGGVLKLVLTILSLELPPYFVQSRRLVACISRLKSKSLCMLLTLCESEPISFLDEVVGNHRTKEFAMAVVQQILALLKAALLDGPTVVRSDEEEQIPTGLVQITSLQLADILSDDSNFRNFVMDGITRHLVTVLAATPLNFHARWCGGVDGAHLAVAERDATLIYDTFHAAGAAMLVQKSGLGLKPFDPQQDYNSGCTLSVESPMALSTQERSSLLVKLFANFFCFNPEICSADQKDRFLHLFLECLAMGPLCPDDALFFLTIEQTAVRICENLHKLIEYVVSSPVEAVNDEDLLLVSEFSAALHEAICPSCPTNNSQEPPVISFVRESHERKLRGLIQRRQQLERWQQLKIRADKLRELESRNSALVASDVIPSPGLIDLIDDGHVQERDIEIPSAGLEISLTLEEMSGQAQAEHKQDRFQSAEEILVHGEINKPEDEVHNQDHEGCHQEDQIGKQLKDTHMVDADSKQAEDVHPRTSEVTASVEELIGPLRRLEVLNHSDSSEPGRKIEQECEPQEKDKSIVNVNEGWNNAEQPCVAQQQSTKLVAGDETRIRGAGKEQRRAKEKQKRKRNIMNERQIALLESQLASEPEMQRKPKLIQEWTDVLKRIGPEVTENQLKNWLNNRKQRLARLARTGTVTGGFPREEQAHNARSASGQPASTSLYSVDAEQPGATNSSNQDSEAVTGALTPVHHALQHGTAEPMAEAQQQAEITWKDIHENPSLARAPRFVKGQEVVLLDQNGRSLGIGTIDELEGIWRSKRLDEQNLCLVEVTDLKVEKGTPIPYPSQRGGATFEQAEALLGIIMVFWNMSQMRAV